MAAVATTGHPVLLGRPGRRRRRPRQVAGRFDKIASDPVEAQDLAQDILATIYHLLGIDPGTTLPGRQGRSLPLLPEGEVIAEAIA